MALKLVALAAVAAVAATNPNGCAPVPTDANGRTPSCGTNVTVSVVLHPTTPAIEVRALTQCSHAPQTFNVVLTLFRVTDKGNIPVSDNSGRLNNSCDAIPEVGITIDCIWWVQPCIYNDLYQGYAKINGTGDDGTGVIETFERQEVSPITRLKCR
jgi:hypothetical protein